MKGFKRVSGVAATALILGSAAAFAAGPKVKSPILGTAERASLQISGSDQGIDKVVYTTTTGPFLITDVCFDIDSGSCNPVTDVARIKAGGAVIVSVPCHECRSFSVGLSVPASTAVTCASGTNVQSSCTVAGIQAFH